MAAIAWLLANWRLVLAGAAALALLVGAGYMYHQGGAAQRSKDAAATITETTDAIHQKAKADDNAARASDRDLIDGVR